MIVVDLETEGIAPRPEYPPVPVGCALRKDGKSRYLAWGHPTGNNCSLKDARAELLLKVYGSGEPLLFHNAKFDVDVLQTHLGWGELPWSRVHDTLYLLFLDDPGRAELSLKPSAEYLLGWAPEERDAVADWLVERQPVPGVTISRSKSSDHYWARYICLAPGDLVGKYAVGDVDRTEGIFELLHPLVLERGMGEAYDRERRLMPILLESERAGLPVHLEDLTSDVALYEDYRERLVGWVRRRLGAGPDLNLASGQQLVGALSRVGAVDLDALGVTPKSGKPRSDKESLAAAITDKQLLSALLWITQSGTSLQTFMRPWLATAERSGGRIFTSWNQVRGAEGGGTRTGRLSSSPNFQNIPNAFKPSFRELTRDPLLKKTLPSSPVKGLPELPSVRGYVAPPDGHLLVGRDWSQQEPRILAHFDSHGNLGEQYREDPWLDFHDNVRQRLAETGRDYPRKRVKGVNLGLIYGQGVGLLAEMNDMSVAEARQLKEAILGLYPGLRAMYQEMRGRAARNEPIRTWGGREYYCEEPRFVNGQYRRFDYKLVNTLIQGSAADQAKEAMIRWAATADPSWRLLINVHDELLASAPRRQVGQAMECLRAAMEDMDGFDVPMKSEGEVGDSWGAMIEWDVKGKKVA